MLKALNVSRFISMSVCNWANCICLLIKLAMSIEPVKRQSAGTFSHHANHSGAVFVVLTVLLSLAAAAEGCA